MENKVIKVLEENRLFDDCENKIFINKPNEFFDNYKLNYSSKHFIPNNATRKDGAILLDEIPYIVSDLNNNEGHTYGFWILLCNGSKLFLKEEPYQYLELELVFKELCKQLNIPCANYELVKMNDKYYTASLSFLKQDEFLFDYYDLERILRAIERNPFPEDTQKIEIDELLKKSYEVKNNVHLLKTIFIDTLTNNKDRFPHNYKLIKTRSGFKNAPLFDNGGCLNKIHKNIFQMPSYNGRIDNESIYFRLLQDDNIRNYMIDNITKIKPEKIASNIYSDKKLIISDITYTDFDAVISENKLAFNESLKVYNHIKR